MDRVKNADMWITVSRLSKDREVMVAKVRAHTGVAGNERADFLAGSATNKDTSREPQGKRHHPDT